MTTATCGRIPPRWQCGARSIVDSDASAWRGRRGEAAPLIRICRYIPCALVLGAIVQCASGRARSTQITFVSCRLQVRGAHVVRKTVDVLTADTAGSPIVQAEYAGSPTGTEKALAEVLADVLRVERVPVD